MSIAFVIGGAGFLTLIGAAIFYLMFLHAYGKDRISSAEFLHGKKVIKRAVIVGFALVLASFGLTYLPLLFK